MLITDGGSYDGKNVPSLLPDMKRLGIVLDFILISGEYEMTWVEQQEVVSIIKGVCEETRGEFIHVAKQGDFEKKFFEVSRRLLLPAPPSK